MTGRRKTATIAVVAAGLLAGVGAGATAADTQRGWLCVADKAIGFRYDKLTKSWADSRFSTNGKYIVRHPIPDDLKEAQQLGDYAAGDVPPAYIARDFGSDNDIPLIVVICNGAPDEKSGIMLCDHGLAQFAINTHLLRMQRFYGIGYLHQDKSAFGPQFADAPDSPLIEIGRCSPL
jgi:hypothetical protein